VVEHPLSLEFVVRVAAHHLAAHFPRTTHVLNQIIAPFGWSLCVRAQRYKSDQDSDEEQTGARAFHQAASRASADYVFKPKHRQEAKLCSQIKMPAWL